MLLVTFTRPPLVRTASISSVLSGMTRPPRVRSARPPRIVLDPTGRVEHIPPVGGLAGRRTQEKGGRFAGPSPDQRFGTIVLDSRPTPPAGTSIDIPHCRAPHGPGATTFRGNNNAEPQEEAQ